MFNANVMLRDVADSRRITNHYHLTGAEKNFSSLVVSNEYWPPAGKVFCKMPSAIQMCLSLTVA
jgi:hypothetical protein